LNSDFHCCFVLDELASIIMENTKILFEKENELMLLNDKCERMMSEVFLFDNRIAEMVLEVSKAKEKVALAIEGIIPVLLQF